MNSAWLRLVRSTYGKDPIVRFVLTVGIVETAIGGLNTQGALFAFGLGTVGVASALRWQQRRQIARLSERAPIYALPASDARSRLPELKPKRKLSGGKR